MLPPLASIVRTHSRDPRFLSLVAALDAELCETYGEVQALYDPHNVVSDVETAVLAVDEAALAVGCGCFRARGDAVELKRMYVAPSHRGRGVAAIVVSALEAWARQLGATSVVLETGTLQHAAIRLYARCGYAVVPNFPPYSGLPASVCMAKPLP